MSGYPVENNFITWFSKKIPKINVNSDVKEQCYIKKQPGQVNNEKYARLERGAVNYFIISINLLSHHRKNI